MSTHDTRKPSFDDVLESIRNDEPSRAEIESSAARVREQLGLSVDVAGSTVHIESCAGFQALIQAYLLGRLPGQTALLLEDHEGAVTEMAPGDPARRCVPRVIKRALVATGTTDHRIPVVACLVRPSAGATEPPHGTAAALWRWFRARARRLVRGPRVRS